MVDSRIDKLKKKLDLGIYHPKRKLDSKIHKPSKKLGSAREVFLHPGNDLKTSLDGLIDIYRCWVEEPTYCSAEYYDKEEHKTKFRFWKASKRGNDIYAQKVRKKLDDRLPSTKQLRKKDLLADRSGTNCMHIVLTVDPKQFLGSLKAAWFNLQYHLNKFLSAFRKRYGKCWVVKSVEAQKNGFPHIHLFVLSNHKFNCEWYRGEDYDYWLIPAKEGVHNATNLSGEFVNGFENLWSLGFVFARGIGDKPNSRSKINILDYVMKDVISDVGEVPEEGGEDKGKVLSLALNWLFRKQSFSISGEDLLENFFDLILPNITKTEILKNGFLSRLFDFARYEFVRFCGIVKLVRPPPDGFVSLSSSEINDLEANAVGVNAGVSLGVVRG